MAAFRMHPGFPICTVNKPAFDAYMEKAGPVVHTLFERVPHIRDPYPRDSSGRAPAGIEEQVAANLGLSAEDMRRYRGAGR